MAEHDTLTDIEDLSEEELSAEALLAEQAALRSKVEASEQVLSGLESDLAALDEELQMLAQREPQFAALELVCRSLEDLEELGAADLFWNAGSSSVDPAGRIEDARHKIAEHRRAIGAIEDRREPLLASIGRQNENLDYLHYGLNEVIEREENLKSEWLVEREPDRLPDHVQIMPWARGFEEDRRFRKSLGTSVLASLALALMFSTIALPIVKRSTINEVPERVAKLVREQMAPPPPPAKIEEPVLEEELPEPELEPEPEPMLVEEQPPEVMPVATEETAVAAREQPDVKEQVKAKGILAFRDSFATRANMKPTAQLGSQATLRTAGEDAIGRPERAMVTSLASGSSGGINLASISRDVGGGGGPGIGGVEVTRVASSIGGGTGNSDRPLSGGASAGRTDEEIQIVFDRYKAALYRLYNRELRKDPTLRGQLVLRLTIEPDGTVSFCTLQSTDMNAPLLTEQVVERVSTFDFGAKEDIVAVTIIYPIDFLPAA